ncbi:MAG: hypothetical protein ACRDH0_02015 [Actinomycetota bacterium]
MRTKLPFQVREAIVEVCGKAFWLKDPLKSLMLSAGVPVELYERYADESKFKIARHILAWPRRGWSLRMRCRTCLAS